MGVTSRAPTVREHTLDVATVDTLAGFASAQLRRPKVITCPKCSKDNQDHYKFCLGCGAELPREVGTEAVRADDPAARDEGRPVAAPAAPMATAAVPATSGRRHFVRARAAAPSAGRAGLRLRRPLHRPLPRPPPPAAAAAPGGGTVICPQCSHVNRPTNVFCGSCGFRLGGRRVPAGRGGCTGGAVLLEKRRGTSCSPRSAPTAAKPARTTLPARQQVLGRDTGEHLRRRQLPLAASRDVQAAGGRLTVKDEASLNGVYKKLARDEPMELQPNDVFRIGQEIIRFEPLDAAGRLRRTASSDSARPRRATSRASRSSSAATRRATRSPFRKRASTWAASAATCSSPKTATSPASTAAWRGRRAGITLTDLGSSNGTFIRFTEETEVRSTATCCSWASSCSASRCDGERVRLIRVDAHDPRRRGRPRARRALPHHAAARRRRCSL